MNVLHKLHWILIKRSALRKRGIQCHIKSYCSKDSLIGNYAELRGNTQLWSSNIGQFTKITESKLVKSDVGAFCSIATGCQIGGGGRHPTDQVSTHKAFYCAKEHFTGLGHFTGRALFDDSIRKVQIRDDVWIGQNCIVMEGISIGTGAIIGAGAVVTKNVEPFSIVGGVPAKFIRFRHSEEIRKALLDSKWWTWPTEKIMKISTIFNAEKPLTLEIWLGFIATLEKEGT